MTARESERGDEEPPADAPTDAADDAPGTATDETETTLARFTEWFARTPNACELREVFVTDRRLLAPVVGESFRAALLRADTGETGRRRLDDRSPDEIAASADCDVAVPLSALRSIRLRRGSLVRRAALTVEWTTRSGSDALTLYNTSEGDEQTDALATLAADDRLRGVACTVETPWLGLL